MQLNERTVEAQLIPPCGAELVNLLVPDEARDELKAYGSQLPSSHVTERVACDLELLASGGFSPLDRFMGPKELQRVIAEMRLSDGHLFPIPVILPVEPSDTLRLDRDLGLRNAKNELLAILRIEEIFAWDPAEMAKEVLGATDPRHPLVAEMHSWGRLNLSGRLQVLQLPQHADFQDLRLTPAQTRVRLAGLGCSNVVAFQTRNPLHRAHEELTRRAIQEVQGALLLHPVVGLTKPGDIDHFTHVRAYKALVEQYCDPDHILLSLLPLAMRLAGPREALWHALISRNYGANHMIVGRDHAGPGQDSGVRSFYGPYAAQELVERHQAEVGVKMIPFRELVYLPAERRYEEVNKVAAHTPTASISGTQVREQYLKNGHKLPEWFTRPEVAEILAKTYPPRSRQGVCIWLTGLSGAGKSTTAEVLAVSLLEHGRHVTVLDGDVVRTHLSKGLGFSREDRDVNVRRIGFVAAEIVRHGGIVICAAVSPYRITRNAVRGMMPAGHFVEVFVDTPLEVCEARDVKGMYAKARRGEIKVFTGINDPYEPPSSAELTLNTATFTPKQNAGRILDYLATEGFVSGPSAGGAPLIETHSSNSPAGRLARKSQETMALTVRQNPLTETRGKEAAPPVAADLSRQSWSPTISVVIPTLNEERNLPHVLPNLHGLADEVILVDGHSSDKTVDAARELYPGIRVVMQQRRGKGDALRAGFEAAKGDIIVMLDADGSTDPIEIPVFVGALLSGADFAKGSRFLHGGGTADMPFVRRLGNWGLVMVVRLLFGGKYTDLCYGYNAFWKHVLPSLKLDGDGFEIETMMNVRALRTGLKVMEVPSFEFARVHGEGHLRTIPDGWRVLVTILNEAWNQRARTGRNARSVETLRRLRRWRLRRLTGREQAQSPRWAGD